MSGVCIEAAVVNRDPPGRSCPSEEEGGHQKEDDTRGYLVEERSAT